MSREPRPLCADITTGPTAHPCRYPVKYGVITRMTRWAGYCGVHVQGVLNHSPADAFPWEELGPGVRQVIRDAADRRLR